MVCALCNEPAKFHCYLCGIYYCCIEHLEQDAKVHDATCDHDAKYMEILKQSSHGCNDFEIQQLSQLKLFCRNICLQIAMDSLLSGNYEQAQTSSVRSLKYAVQIFSDSSHEILENYLMISEVYVYLKQYETAEIGLQKVETRLRLETQADIFKNREINDKKKKDVELLEKETLNTLLMNEGVQTLQEYVNLRNAMTSFRSDCGIGEGGILALNARLDKVRAVSMFMQQMHTEARELAASALYLATASHGPESIAILEYFDIYLIINQEYFTKVQINQIHDNIVTIINSTLLQHFSQIQIFALSSKKAINLIELFKCGQIKDPIFGKNLVIARNFLNKLQKANVKFQEFLIDLILDPMMLKDFQLLRQRFRKVTTNVKCTQMQLQSFSNLYNLVNYLYKDYVAQSDSFHLIDDSSSESEVQIAFM